MLKALLWKDYRVNVFVLALGFILLVGPPLTGAVASLIYRWRFGVLMWSWSDMLVFTIPFSLCFNLLTMATLGGAAFAAERADRSAEFLAYLPPSRRMIVASKAILAVGAALTIWLIDLTLVYVVAPQLGHISEELVTMRDDMLANVAPAALLLLAGAWFGSTFLPTATLATFFGILFPIALLGTLGTTGWLMAPRPFDVGFWYRTLAWPMGAAVFVIGTAYYLRRTAP